jgi:hypothetical protein
VIAGFGGTRVHFRVRVVAVLVVVDAIVVRVVVGVSRPVLAR